ncbi:MAG: DoxX family protein [Mucilaginibacter sp.]
MKPLFVLIFAFVVTILVVHFLKGGWDYVLSGNVAMASMLLFTAIGHFVYWKGMTMMVPAFIPAKKTLVYLTGIMEIALAAGLCISSTRRLSADLLILFFLLVLPANINAAQKTVDYQKATFEGRGVSYLWLRIPMQVFFIVWASYFGIILEQGL